MCIFDTSESGVPGVDLRALPWFVKMSQAPAIKARQGQGFRMDNDIRCPDDPVRAVLLSTVADHAVKDADGRDVGERCPLRGDELGDVSLEEQPGFRVRLAGRTAEMP